MAGLNRAMILTTLMTLAGAMASDPAWADQGKERKFAPPGLQDKGFVPPGVAKKWVKGDIIPATVAIVPFHDWASLSLAPPPPGAFYGYVDNDLLLIANATHKVLDSVIAVDAAVNTVK